MGKAIKLVSVCCRSTCQCSMMDGFLEGRLPPCPSTLSIEVLGTHPGTQHSGMQNELFSQLRRVRHGVSPQPFYLQGAHLRGVPGSTAVSSLSFYTEYTMDIQCFPVSAGD